MADREININAKIANLQKIKEELSNLKVDVKFNSSAIDELIKAAKSGLTLKVKFNMGPEFKQLLDLQKNGIKINVGTGAKPLTGGNIKLVSEQESLYNLGKSNLRPDKIRAHLDRLDAEEAKILQLREKQLKAVRDRLEKANNFVREDPLSALLGNDVRGAAASRFNVPRSGITASPNFFNLGRLKNPNNLQNILFTTLLGGPAQGLGAAAGVATLGGPGGLIGANVAAALEKTFGDIAEAMSKAVRAGAEYERAVTGITGIFQATSEITDRSGTPLPLSQQLLIQRQRAEGIQGASQRALLPLGITGEAASALTKSFSAGLAQRGLAPDEKSTETILGRLGAAIQTLQPELAGDANALQRTVEDIIGGSPQAQRTELGSAIKGLAPDLFKGGIRSTEDIIRATESLEQLKVALQNNDTATVQYTRAIGTLRLAQQELGRGILEGLAPGMKALAEELTKAEFQGSLKELGKSIGEAATALTQSLLPAIQALPTQIKGAVDAIKNLGSAGGKAASGDFKGAAEDYAKNFQIEPGADSEGLARALLRFRGIRAGASSKELTEEEEKNLSPKDFLVRASIKSVISRAVNNYGLTNPRESAENDLRGSAAFKLSGLQGLRKTLQSRSSGRSFSDVFTEQIGLNSQEIALRRQAQEERNSLFDQGDFGQFRRAQDEKGGLRDQIKLAEDTVSKRKTLLAQEEGKLEKDEEAIAQARIAVQQAEREAIKLRNEVADKEKELAERRLAIFQKQLAAIDQTTFKGKREALGLTKDFNLNQGLDIDRQIAAQDRIINSTASAPEIQAAKDRKSELVVQRQANVSAQEEAKRQQQRNGLAEVTFALGGPLRREAAADAQKKSQIDLQQLDIASKELAVEQHKLAQATKDATKALQDFEASARLRELGREGKEIAAAEAIVASGGAVPGGVDASLVRGSDTFDPEARARFERRVAEEQFDETRRQNNYERREGDSDTQQRLEDDQTQARLNEEKFKFKPEEYNLQKRQILRDQKNQAIQNATEAQRALEQDPDNPKLQQEYQNAYQKLQEAKQQSEAAETSGALTAPSGPPSTVNGMKIGQDGEPVDAKGNPITLDSLPYNAETGQYRHPITGEVLNYSYQDKNRMDREAKMKKISSAEQPQLIADNSIGSAILGGIGGSGAYARAKSSSEKGTQAAVDILQGLGKDAAGRLKEDKEKGDRGNSVFDDLTALKPLSKEDMTAAFSAALQQNFA